MSDQDRPEAMTQRTEQTPGASMDSCTVRVLRAADAGPPTLDPIRHRSDAFSFCDTAWLAAWDRAFLPGNNWSRPLDIYVVTSAGSTIGFLAVAEQRLFRVRIKSLAGYYWPFRTVAVGDGEVARARFSDSVADHLTAHVPGVALRFGPVSSQDLALSRLVGALVDRGWCALRRCIGDVYELALPADRDALERQVSASLLKNVRYLRRRLEKSVGPVRCERQALGADSGELLQVVAQIESASWVARRGGESKFMGPANYAFWSTLGLLAGGRCSEIILWVLRCGSTPIGFSAHLEVAHTIYIIANGYDEEWKGYSPGSILSLEILTDACAREKAHISWGQGDSGYKSRWGATSGETRLFDFLLLRPGLVGRSLAFAVGRLQPGWEPIDPNCGHPFATPPRGSSPYGTTQSRGRLAHGSAHRHGLIR